MYQTKTLIYIRNHQRTSCYAPILFIQLTTEALKCCSWNNRLQYLTVVILIWPLPWSCSVLSVLRDWQLQKHPDRKYYELLQAVPSTKRNVHMILQTAIWDQHSTCMNLISMSNQHRIYFDPNLLLLQLILHAHVIHNIAVDKKGDSGHTKEATGSTNLTATNGLYSHALHIGNVCICTELEHIVQATGRRQCFGQAHLHDLLFVNVHSSISQTNPRSQYFVKIANFVRLCDKKSTGKWLVGINLAALWQVLVLAGILCGIEIMILLTPLPFYGNSILARECLQDLFEHLSIGMLLISCFIFHKVILT